MAVAVKTTAIKASAMEGREAPFRDDTEQTPTAVSNDTVPVQSAEIPKTESDGPRRSVSEQEHCTKDSLLVLPLVS